MVEQSEELLEELPDHLPCLGTQDPEVEFLPCYMEACYWEGQTGAAGEAVVEAVESEEWVAAGLLVLLVWLALERAILVAGLLCQSSACLPSSSGASGPAAGGAEAAADEACV